MQAAEQRADLYLCDDAEVLLVACTTPARMAKGAVQRLRQQGIKARASSARSRSGRSRSTAPRPLCRARKRIVVVEATNGQLEDELRLALAHAGVRDSPEIEHVRHFGGVLPQLEEIVAKVLGRGAR